MTKTQTSNRKLLDVKARRSSAGKLCPVRSRSTSLLCGVLLAACSLFGMAHNAAAVQTYSWSDPPATRPADLKSASYDLYIPDTVAATDRIRGVILVSRHEAGTQAFEHALWRDLAAEQKFAMLCYRARALDNNTAITDGTLTSILQALTHFAAATGRPELAHSGLIPTGLSRGGGQTTRMVAQMPSRFIAAVPMHGGGAPAETPETRAVPCLVVIGGGDTRVSGARALTDTRKGVAAGALWAVLMQPDIAHHHIGNQDFIVQWMRAMILARVPAVIPMDRPPTFNTLAQSSGWLGTLTLNGDAPPYTITGCTVASFAAPAAGKDWLPNRAVAEAWREYQQTGGAPARPIHVYVRPIEDGVEGGSLHFVFSRAGHAGVDSRLSVNYSVGGTATPDVDFKALPGEISFRSGHTTATLNVPILTDDLREGKETVTITLQGHAEHKMQTELATGTISDTAAETKSTPAASDEAPGANTTAPQ